MIGRTIEDPRRRIERMDDPDEVWLYCDECRRFFRYTAALAASGHDHERCPFDDCLGVGLGFQLFLWDDFREPADPRWPSTTDELEHGLQSPDMEPFYAAQLAARIDALVTELAGSPELRAAVGDDEVRYAGGFLKMMSDLCWDLTEPCEAGFSRDVAAELIWDTPVWCHVADTREAARMAAEVRALFAFAERANRIEHAPEWSELLASVDLADIFRFTMETDRRLRRPAAPDSARMNERPARGATKNRRKNRRKNKKRRR